jgi:hypothetical protein
VSPVKYELGFYIPEDGFLHSHRRENLKYYMITRNLALGTGRSAVVNSLKTLSPSVSRFSSNM